MSEKMQLAQHIETGLDDETEGFFAPPLNREEWRTIVAALRTSSPAQEPVTTEPVAWRYQRKEWDALLWRYQTEALVNDDFETPGDWLIEPLYAIPAPPQPGRDAVIEECAQAITSLRQSGATIFDAKHSGQRGEDRSTALYDAINVVHALTGEPK